VNRDVKRPRIRSNDGAAGASLRFAPWKNSLAGTVLTLAAAAGAIRTPVNNRVHNEPIRPAVANRCRRSWIAGETVLPLSLITVLTVARTSMPSLRRMHIGSAGEPGRARPVSSVIRLTKSGPQAYGSPSPANCHRRSE